MTARLNRYVLGTGGSSELLQYALSEMFVFAADAIAVSHK